MSLPGGSELILIFLILLPIILVFVDISRRSFNPPYHKALWIALVLFFPLLGIILYFLLGRPKSSLNQ